MTNESPNKQPDGIGILPETEVQAAFAHHQIEQAANGDYATFSDDDDPTKVKIETSEETNIIHGISPDPAGNN